jgi:CheY-like chemotaxis protein
VDGLTVLVVDGELEARTRLLLCLRRLGLRALGVDFATDAIALLEALDADVTLIVSDDDDETLEPLRRKTVVVKLDRATPVDEAVVALLRALGRPEEAAMIN